MYKVEIRSGVLTENARNHTWVYIEYPDGTTVARGFYPAEEGPEGLNGPGEVRDDLITEHNASSGVFHLDQEAFDRLNGFIDRTTANPPPYSLAFGSHCTVWALTALAEAGAIPHELSPGMTPNNIWTDFVQTLIWNPIWQYAGFNLWDKINPTVQTHFRASQLSASPLILDLDGDGIEITQHTGAITFDHDANGIETGTAWAGADDGLLVLDRDGNGSIDTGRELFGNNTLLANGQKAADGYAALRELDSNADGVLDASDAAFANLRVWRDLDQDGNSDAGELFSLNEVGVSQIGLSKAAFSQTQYARI